jgi:hypothetical protein
MARHERAPRSKKPDVNRQRPRQHESPARPGPSPVREERASPLAETPYQPPMEQHAGLLANTLSTEQGQGLLRQLNQSYGNEYVQRLLRSMSNSSASPQGETAAGGPVQQSAPVTSVKLMRDRNSAGLEVGFSTVFRTTKSEVAEEDAPTTVEETSTMSGANDSISPGSIVLAQQMSVGRSALTSTNFGSYTPNITKNVSVEKIPGTFFDDWKVTALMTISYTYSIQSRDKTDIPNAYVDAVDEASWPAVYSDLYPEGGSRSPRRWYWCSDLSAQHEMYHIMDCMNAFKTFAPLEEQWLEQQTTYSRGGAERLGMQALNQLEARAFNYMGGDQPNAAQETRAYGAGASQYIARAEEVKDRAIAEGWTEEDVEDEEIPEDEEEEEEVDEEESEEEEGESESWWDDLWDDLWEDEEEVEEETEEESEEETEEEETDEEESEEESEDGYAYNEEDYDYLYGEESSYEEESNYGYGEEGYGYSEEDYGYGYEEESYYEEDDSYGYGQESYSESEDYYY